MNTMFCGSTPRFFLGSDELIVVQITMAYLGNGDWYWKQIVVIWIIRIIMEAESAGIWPEEIKLGLFFATCAGNIQICIFVEKSWILILWISEMHIIAGCPYD